jgi:hypothetical protein
LTDSDQAALQAIAKGNDWLRAVLCTLARRGLAFQREQPTPAEALLAALSRYPLYKAGQFLFDLMEWEDFMLDGPPPAMLPTVLDARALERLAAALRAVQAHLDGEAAPSVAAEPSAPPGLTAAPADEELPSLEPSLFLFQSVALGVFISASAGFAMLDIEPDE